MALLLSSLYSSHAADEATLAVCLATAAKLARQCIDGRNHVTTGLRSVQDTPSILQQASPYLLATAMMPVNILMAVWRAGVNSPLDQRHVAALARRLQEASGGRIMTITLC